MAPAGFMAGAVFGGLAEWTSRLLYGFLRCGLGLTLINLPTYRFFQRQRGWLFAAKTVPWHWLYFFYSGLVYAYGMARYRLRSG